MRSPSPLKGPLLEGMYDTQSYVHLEDLGYPPVWEMLGARGAVFRGSVHLEIATSSHRILIGWYRYRLTVAGLDV